MELSALSLTLLGIATGCLLAVSIALFVLTLSVKRGATDMSKTGHQRTERLVTALGSLQSEHARAMTAFLEQVTRMVERSLADSKNQADITQDASKRHLEATAALLGDAEKRISAASQRFMDDQLKAFGALTKELASVIESQRDVVGSGLTVLQAAIKLQAESFSNAQLQAQTGLTKGILDQGGLMERAVGQLSDATRDQARALAGGVDKQTAAIGEIVREMQELKSVIQSDIEAGLPTR